MRAKFHAPSFFGAEKSVTVQTKKQTKNKQLEMWANAQPDGRPA